MNLNSNVVLLTDTEKGKWIILQENLVMLAALGTYNSCCFEERNS